MEGPKVLRNLVRAWYWFDDSLQASLAAAGFEPVSRSQSLLLANLAMGENRAGRLAKSLGVTRQAVAKMIDEFERRGFLETVPDPSDSRAKIITYTKAGEPMRKAARQILRGLEAELQARIGASTFETFNQVLDGPWDAPPSIIPVTKSASSATARKGPTG